MTRKRISLLALAGMVAVALAIGLTGGWLSHQATLEFGNDQAPVVSGRLLQYERVARVIWGNVCHGDVALSLAPLRDGQAGQASWQPDGMFTNCAIIINSSQHFSDHILCLVVVHEMGHLAGKGHSRDPDSVMYPRASERNVPWRCR